jgi:hypothetical protein
LCYLIPGCNYYGGKAIARQELDAGISLIIILADSGIDLNGTITKWTVYAQRAGKATLQIWRKVGASSFTLVGQSTEKNYSKTGQHGHADRVEVKQGDLLGLYFSNLNPIPFTPGTCGSDPDVYYTYMATPGPVVGQTYSRLYRPLYPCRIYSIQVQVEN